MNIEKVKKDKEARDKTNWEKGLIYEEGLNQVKIRFILTDALYYNKIPHIIRQYISQAKNNLNTYNKTSKKRISDLITELELYSEYKFLIIGGAMLEKRTIYEKSHSDAWETINKIITNELHGMVLSTIAYELNGVSTNAIENLEKMYLRPTKDKIRAALMSDFLPNFKPMECCREEKLKSILKKN